MKEEGRRKKEEGRRKKEEGRILSTFPFSYFPIFPSLFFLRK
ncbi:hypothetical protein Q5692_11005 [Microcoleus sp. C2C3]